MQPDEIFSLVWILEYYFTLPPRLQIQHIIIRSNKGLGWRVELGRDEGVARDGYKRDVVGRDAVRTPAALGSCAHIDLRSRVKEPGIQFSVCVFAESAPSSTSCSWDVLQVDLQVDPLGHHRQCDVLRREGNDQQRSPSATGKCAPFLNTHFSKYKNLDANIIKKIL